MYGDKLGVTDLDVIVVVNGRAVIGSNILPQVIPC